MKFVINISLYLLLTLRFCEINCTYSQNMAGQYRATFLTESRCHLWRSATLHRASVQAFPPNLTPKVQRRQFEYTAKLFPKSNPERQCGLLRSGLHVYYSLGDLPLQDAEAEVFCELVIRCLKDQLTYLLLYAGKEVLLFNTQAMEA